MSQKIGVIIPCYKVKKHILDVIDSLGSEVEHIIVVDDKCPQNSGNFVLENCTDKRVTVIFNPVNLGVGGSVIEGFKVGTNLGVDILVKVDGDGQIPTYLIPDFVRPIQEGQYHYCKGNRFFYLNYLEPMPKLRIFGNSILSFLNKVTTGYWDIMDPTNGFVAIRSDIFKLLSHDKISKRYFFESDMMYQLSLFRARIFDYPMKSIYNDEESNLSILNTILTFPPLYCRRLVKRLFYNYFLRDFNPGSLALLFGLVFLVVGPLLTGLTWWYSLSSGKNSSSGTIALCFTLNFLAFHFLLFFLQYDFLFYRKYLEISNYWPPRNKKSVNQKSAKPYQQSTVSAQ